MASDSTRKAINKFCKLHYVSVHLHLNKDVQKALWQLEMLTFRSTKCFTQSSKVSQVACDSHTVNNVEAYLQSVYSSRLTRWQIH